MHADVCFLDLNNDCICYKNFSMMKSLEGKCFLEDIFKTLFIFLIAFLNIFKELNLPCVKFEESEFQNCNL